MAWGDRLKKIDGLHKLHTWYWVHIRMPLWWIVAISRVRFNYRRDLTRLRRISQTRKLRVAFIVSELSKWKGQSVYDVMSKSREFLPFVAVIPSALDFRDAPSVERTVAEKISFFRKKGMMVRSAWNERVHKVVDINDLDADILFYQQPWDDLGRLSPVCAAKRALTFYFSYYMVNNCEFKLEIEQVMHRLLFGYIVFSERLAKTYEEYIARNRLSYVAHFLPLGHPMMDRFAIGRKCAVPKGYVIYAPHFTISFGTRVPYLKYSTFMLNGKAILEFAKAHPEIRWVFKPHPRLRGELVDSGAMSKTEVDAYYAEWERIGVSCYTSEYVGLMLSSRAMITDCGSFLTEYAATGQPLIRLINPELNVKPHPSLETLYSTYYNVHDFKEMYEVFDRVLLREIDDRCVMRCEAAREAGLLGSVAAENIYRYLVRLMELDKVNA